MRYALVVAGLIAGLLSERGVPGLWLTDLAVGMAFIALGAFGPAQAKGGRILLVATGLAWFAGNLNPALWFWHRGPLVHLLVTQPGWRPRSKLGWTVIAAGYLAAVIQPVWYRDLFAVPLVTALLILQRRLNRSGGTTLAFALVLYIGAATRWAFPAGETASFAIFAYQAVLCGIAVTLAWRLRHPADETVTDRVIDLTEGGSVRDAMAQALGDRTLRIGYWQAGRYVDEEGAPVEVEGAATHVDEDGRPFAVIVHDQALLTDRPLLDAVTTAIRLTGAHAALRAETEVQLTELEASRRRLVVAADEERRRLEERLHEGPMQRLDGLLAGLPEGRSASLLATALGELRDLARGLYPGELGAALKELADRSPVPVRVHKTAGPAPVELETAIYYVCAEALSNVAKHANASAVELRVEAVDDLLLVTVTDDGQGGADAEGGTGLRGLADRVEALGGHLRIDSSPAGTRLTASFALEVR